MPARAALGARALQQGHLVTRLVGATKNVAAPSCLVTRWPAARARAGRCACGAHRAVCAAAALAAAFVLTDAWSSAATVPPSHDQDGHEAALHVDVLDVCP